MAVCSSIPGSIIPPKQKGAAINIGGYVNLQQDLSARRDKINETFTYSSVGTLINIDTVDYKQEESGKIKMPMTYGLGFTYQDKNRNWLVGVDYEATNWSKYRYYDEQDAVKDNWVIRAGAEYYPAKPNSAANKYWSFVKQGRFLLWPGLYPTE